MRIEDATSVLVTGGASGLGEAVVRRFAANGSKVSILDRDVERGKAIASETGASMVPCDVSDDAAVARAVAEAIDRNGIPRVTVICAGIAAGGGLVTFSGDEQFERFDRIFKTNVYGTFSVMRHVARHMITLSPLEFMERGVIVTTASIAAFEGQIDQAVYAASKAAVAGLTLPAARDLCGHGVRVCSIAPGVFDTPISGPSAPLVESLAREIPFPQVRGQPAYFASLVEQIVENVFLNGEVIRLDGALRTPAFRGARPEVGIPRSAPG
jgi:NAD(P)-dependent dehydrogenase (short-subunit alcohol dehydrogenase family)